MRINDEKYWSLVRPKKVNNKLVIVHDILSREAGAREERFDRASFALLSRFIEFFDKLAQIQRSSSDLEALERWVEETFIKSSNSARE